MPVYPDDEISRMIAKGAIKAIAPDTNVFDRYGCNLSFPVLRRLDQFANGATSLLLSEIVEREVLRHISEEAAETQKALKKALREQGRRWRIDKNDMAAPATYCIDDDPQIAAAIQVEVFVRSTGAQRIAALGQHDRTSEILDLYFSGKVPFERKEAKKHEFPDAFALLSLESYARQANTTVICVSTDKGWAAYCAKSEHLVCMGDLEAALSLFNKSGRVVADLIVAKLRSAADDLPPLVEDAIQERLAETDFYADGWSSVEFEAEPIESVLSFVHWDSATDPVVIAADDDTVTFTTSIEVDANFQASFSFSVRDGMDRDYVSLGSEEVEVTKRVSMNLAITVLRNPEEGYEHAEIEVARTPLQVSFGTVEPFQSEDPYHEKY